MQIGIIGAHIVGMRLAKEFAFVGHAIRITNSGGRDSIKKKLEEAGADLTIEAASMAEVLDCEIVILAMPWIKVRDMLDPSINWNGRLLIDATNIYLSYPPDYQVDDLKGESGSEIIARLAPAAHVVKAFNTLPFDVMFAPVSAGMKRVLFIAGDDIGAVQTVSRLIDDIGFHPVALGNLATAGRLMELEAPLSLLEVLKPLHGKEGWKEG